MKIIIILFLFVRMEDVAATYEAKILSGKIEAYVKSHELFVSSSFDKRFAELNFDLPEETIIETYATDFYLYSKKFQTYLTNVLNNLQKPSQKESLAIEMIMGNLDEERGVYSIESINKLENEGIKRETFVGVEHPELMKRFIKSSGGNCDYNEGVAKEFMDFMINITAESTACEGLAILAFAVEMETARLFIPIWEGLKKSKMNKEDYVFFPLHIVVDDDHYEKLKIVFENQYDTNPDKCGNALEMVSKVLDFEVYWKNDLEKRLDLMAEARRNADVSERCKI